jgi:AAA+ superfamily predicted ATPase
MVEKKAKRQNKRASQLCSSIEELQVSFLAHRLDFADYSEQDNERIHTVKKFFGLRNAYDLIILCFFIERKLSNDSGITLNKIIKHFQINLEGCIQLNITLKHLIKKHFLVVSEPGYRSNEKVYGLSQNCLKGILEYNRKMFIHKADSFEDFLKDFNSLLSEAGRFPENDFLDKITDQIDEYESTAEIKWLRKQKLTKIAEALLSMATLNHILYNKPLDLEIALTFVADDSFVKYQIQKEFMSGKSHLISEGYLSFSADFFMSRDLKLTDKSVQALCTSECETIKKVFHPKLLSLIAPDQIPEENYLHDNSDLKLIEKMLSRETYEKIRAKVPRLTILLTGAPGVGKTSFLHYLAKKTGRPILSANIAQILSKFIGESEQNLVQLFREAATAYDQYDITPIIVFDEAESLLYKRNPKSTSAASQMNNNLISLLLQSLDRFKGILVCCSNFSFESGNFDQALHRRFHTIAEIASPPENILLSIFHHHFPECTNDETRKFLDKYRHITPAQIRNLRNKYDVQIMIGEIENEAASVFRIAEQDLQLFAGNNRRPIGFTIQHNHQ